MSAFPRIIPHVLVKNLKFSLLVHVSQSKAFGEPRVINFCLSDLMCLPMAHVIRSHRFANRRGVRAIISSVCFPARTSAHTSPNRTVSPSSVSTPENPLRVFAKFPALSMKSYLRKFSTGEFGHSQQPLSTRFYRPYYGMLASHHVTPKSAKNININLLFAPSVPAPQLGPSPHLDEIIECIQLHCAVLAIFVNCSLP